MPADVDFCRSDVVCSVLTAGDVVGCRVLAASDSERVGAGSEWGWFEGTDMAGIGTTGSASGRASDAATGPGRGRGGRGVGMAGRMG
jgi:hypothetical protein